MSRRVLAIIMPAVLLLLLAGSGGVTANPLQHMSYQGRLEVDGEPVNGPALFMFALVEEGGPVLWTNDGIFPEPTSPIPLDVSDGVFHVLLGDPALGMVLLDASILEGRVAPQLRIWVDTGSGMELLPDQPLSSGAYALQSDAAHRALVNFTVGGNLGVGTPSPEERLHVVGATRMDIGSGHVYFTTPGGWPGLIMFSPNGNRRDMIFDDNGLRLLVGSTSSPPGATQGITINQDGDVGIGTLPSATLDVAGNTRTGVLEITGGSDLAERFEIASSGPPIRPGMVVCIDPRNPGKLRVSGEPYDQTVAGVVSGAGSVQPGMLMGQVGTVADGEHPVALTGRVWALCDAGHGAIRPGDLLTTSSTPGHAMRAADPSWTQGAVLGKAMTALEEGTGLVLILVSLQ
jgi:hypothetical protein